MAARASITVSSSTPGTMMRSTAQPFLSQTMLIRSIRGGYQISVQHLSTENLQIWLWLSHHRHLVPVQASAFELSPRIIRRLGEACVGDSQAATQCVASASFGCVYEHAYVVIGRKSYMCTASWESMDGHPAFGRPTPFLDRTWSLHC